MKGKKKFVIPFVIILLLVTLLFPTKLYLKDGGSVEYKSLTYNITKVHRLISDEEAEEQGKITPYEDGLQVKVFGIKVFDNIE